MDKTVASQIILEQDPKAFRAAVGHLAVGEFFVAARMGG